MLENIKALRLPQSKSYLKIIGIPYLMENTNILINSDFVETVIKSSHIFNDLSLTFKLRIIKASPKSDIAIIWIDIQNTQSSKNAKMLINRYFNVRSYIATIYGANMNSKVLQCKNCQKWEHFNFIYRIQGSKCVKCNGLHKSKYY